MSLLYHVNMYLEFLILACTIYILAPQAVKSFEEYLEKIRPTMITKEGTACMDAIDKAWAEYKEVDASGTVFSRRRNGSGGIG